MSKIQSSNALMKSLSNEDNLSGRRVISHAASQSVRPYGSNQEYLYAMREDLADWLKGLYAVDINVVNFFNQLETGTLLCQHANNITTCAEYIRKNNMKVEWKYVKKFPTKYLLFNQGKYVRASSFFARDNIATFIDYCRTELEIPESVMFESNDLVLRHNEKNVILCLLEVARRGSKFGVPAPVLIQMEEDIDKEIEMEKVAKEQNEPPPEPVKQRVNCDFKSLDEMVQHILGMCTCPSQFPMVRISDGKYKVGDSENLIFMRILRQHVMVRVGGGWDTLEHYLNKHDPCRCFKHKNDKSLTPRYRNYSSTGRQSQQANNLTSTGTPLLKSAAANSRRQLGNSRLAKSASNLTDITALSKFEKSPARRMNSSTMSRNSSTSDTSISDTRSTKTKAPRTTGPNLTKTSRNSTNKAHQSEPQEDVFTRLSRPKSTPPVSRQTTTASTFQNDLLMVRRNETGTHRVQRSTVAGTPPRRSQFSRTQTSPDKSESKPSNSTQKPFTTSTATTPRATRPTTPRTGRSTVVATPRTTRSVTPRATRSATTTTPRATRSTVATTPRTARSEKQNPSSKTPRGRQTVAASGMAKESRPKRPLSAVLPKSATFDLDLSPKTTPEASESQVLGDKEREKLEAFEKECISNKLTLEINENNARRQSSCDMTSEPQRLLSRSSAEDNEVAMHMEQTIQKRPKPTHPPSAFSMPKPRKDKVSSHEHPTRIPTPVSFSRPLFSSNDANATPLKKQKAIDLPETKPLLNGKLDDLRKNHTIVAQESIETATPKPVCDGKTSDINDDVFVNGNGERSTKSSEAIKTEVQTIPKSKDDVEKETTNGATWNHHPYTHPDLRQPRIKISVDEINRLLNSSKANVEKFKSKPTPTRAIYTEYPQAELNSANQDFVTSNHAPSAFVRVDNCANGDTKPVIVNSHQHNHSPLRHHPPSSYPAKKHNKPQVKRSVSVDLNDNLGGCNGNKPDFSFFQQGALKNSMLESAVKQNGLKFNQASPNNTDVVWV